MFIKLIVLVRFLVSGGLSTIWNRWTAERRFQRRSSAANVCKLGCSSTAEDSIEHYCQCRVLDAIVSKYYQRKSTRSYPPVDDFFGIVEGLSEDERIIRARLCHVKLRLVHFARGNGTSMDLRLITDVEWNRCAYSCRQLDSDSSAINHHYGGVDLQKSP